jgi:hypothetical protein
MHYIRPLEDIIEKAYKNTLLRMKDVAEAKRHAKYKYKENLKSRKNKRG